MPEKAYKLIEQRTNVTEAHVDNIHLVRGKTYNLTDDQVKRLRDSGAHLTDKVDDKED